MSGNSQGLSVDSLGRLLNLANAVRSRSQYGAFNPGGKPNRTRRRRLRSPEEVEDLLTRELRRTAIVEIAECLGLERCAIVLPIRGKDGFWSLVDEIGLPKGIIERSFYSLGDGLTGMVLQNQLVVSKDILEDGRRSEKYGNEWRDENGIVDPTPRAYIGAPLWVQLTDASQDAVGAIYGIRPATPFSEAEIAAFETAAQLLSLGHDRLRSWRRRSETDLRQLRLSQLWELPLRESEKYYEVLRALKAEFPFSRLLLSLIDRQASTMKGVAALGFRADLVGETNRPVTLENPDEEDILAWVYRERITLPRIVSPSDPEWEKVHQITAFRHQVRNPLLLMPMTESSGKLVGVVLAECPDEHFQLSPHEMRRISLFVNHAGNLIENHRKASGFRELARVWERIHANIFDCDTDNKKKRHVALTRVVNDCCRYFDLSRAALYEVRDSGSSLRGVAGYGLDLDAVTCHHVSLEPVGITSQHDSLLLRSYMSKEAVSVRVEDVDDDCSVLPQFSGELGCCVTGVRVLAAERCVGIFIFAHSARASVCVPPKMTRSLKSFLAAIGHLIENCATIEDAQTARRSASAYHSLALAITEIGKPVTEEESVSDDVPFSSVLRDSANLFDSSLSQLLLCVPREIPKRDDLDIATAVNGLKLIETARYVEAEHKLRFPGRVVAGDQPKFRAIEVTAGNGLTASAVKTLKPVISDDVEHDPFWSKNELELRGLRSFLGLPLYFETDDHLIVYGVLTLTRLRDRVGDSRGFSVEEVQSGQNISKLFSSAFRQRHEFQNVKDDAEEVTARVKRCLRWFRHDIPAMVSDIEDEARACQEMDGEIARDRLLEMTVLSEATRSVFVACALVLGDKRQGRLGDGDNHVLDVSHLRQQLEVLIRRQSKQGDTKIEIRSIPENLLRIFGIRDKPLMYCAFALLQNGLVACYHNRNQTNKKQPGNVELTVEVLANNKLQLIVRDDAGGVGEKHIDDLTEEQYSDWPSPHGQESTGMGLYIVKRLVEEHLNGTLEVRDEKWENRLGAVFTIVTGFTSLETCKPETNDE